MEIIIEAARRKIRALIPRTFKESRLLATLKSKFFKHNWIYRKEYYLNFVDPPAKQSSGFISESIIREFNPKTVVDVGCGTGAMLLALKQKGCDVWGLEFSDAALKICKQRNLDVLKFNLEKNEIIDRKRFDVALSMEVAEHLPEKIADKYIRLLTDLSDIIVFSAATPGQGGDDHVNEQPHTYWIRKFNKVGFSYKKDLSIAWRNAWKQSGTVSGWYYENIMIFCRSRKSFFYNNLNVFAKLI